MKFTFIPKWVEKVAKFKGVSYDEAIAGLTGTDLERFESAQLILTVMAIKLNIHSGLIPKNLPNGSNDLEDVLFNVYGIGVPEYLKDKSFSSNVLHLIKHSIFNSEVDSGEIYVTVGDDERSICDVLKELLILKASKESEEAALLSKVFISYMRLKTVVPKVEEKETVQSVA